MRLNPAHFGATDISDLILRRPRSGRLEGWELARHCLLPSFETRPAGAPQDEVRDANLTT